MLRAGPSSTELSVIKNGSSHEPLTQSAGVKLRLPNPAVWHGLCLLSQHGSGHILLSRFAS